MLPKRCSLKDMNLWFSVIVSELSVHTSSIIEQTSVTQLLIDVAPPVIVTTLSVDPGNISLATCTQAPVIYQQG